MIRVLFFIEQDYYWPSMEPVYRAMAADPQYDLYLQLGENSKRYFYFIIKSQKSRLEIPYRQAGYKLTDEKLGFDAVFCGAPLKKPEEFGSALLCNVDHGPGIKTLRYRHFLNQPYARYVCFVEGAYRIEKFKKYGLDTKEDLVDVGLPKLDRFFDGSFDRQSLFEQFQLDPQKPVVLYAPSYRPTSIFDLGREVVRLSQKYNMIIKLHPYSWTGKYVSHRQHRFFERLEKKYPEVKLIRPHHHDIMPFMFIADTMISDGSSVINEFLALGRCGIIFDLPSKRLQHSDGQPLLEDDNSDWLKNSFIHFNRPEQLEDAVESALYPDEQRQFWLEKDKNYVFSSTDGQAAHRVKQTVEDLLNPKKGEAV